MAKRDETLCDRLLSAAAGALVGALAVDVYRREGAPFCVVARSAVYVVVGAVAGFFAKESSE